MKRIVELDGIRGIAALGIVTYHTGLWLHWRHTRFIGSYLLMFVDVFFVLSGFLITSIIVDQSAGTDPKSFLKSFYVRRMLRIWPAYYLSLFVLFAWGVPLCGEVFPPSWKAYYLTFTQCIECYGGGPVLREYLPFGQSWSIAVEEQFYLMWPLAVLAVGRRLLWMPIALLIVLAVGMRMSGFDSHILVTRCDALALGAALALLLSSKQSYQSKPARTILWTSLLLGASFPVWGRALVRTIRLVRPDLVPTLAVSSIFFLFCNLAFFGAIGLIACHAGSRPLAVLRNRWLCYLGTISYGIYIYHGMVIASLRHFLVYDWNWRFQILAYVLPIAFASLAWHAIEQPILRFKDRFPYRTVARGWGSEVCFASNEADRSKRDSCAFH